MGIPQIWIGFFNPFELALMYFRTLLVAVKWVLYLKTLYSCRDLTIVCIEMMQDSKLSDISSHYLLDHLVRVHIPTRTWLSNCSLLEVRLCLLMSVIRLFCVNWMPLFIPRHAQSCRKVVASYGTVNIHWIQPQKSILTLKTKMMNFLRLIKTIFKSSYLLGGFSFFCCV